MKINRENCESFFLDYYEGNLSKEGVEEMRAFLVMNPDLQEIFDSYENLSFNADTSTTLGEAMKDSLKKDISTPLDAAANGINESNYTTWIVSLLEGTLNEKEEKMVAAFMAANPKVQREFELLKKTIITPESNISFERKSSLKKSIPITADNFLELAVMAMDGELDEVTMNAFTVFLGANADLKAEYESLLSTKLTADDSVVFENKNVLRRTPVVISAGNFEEYAVASLEGTLNAAEQKNFTAFVNSNPVYGKQVALYAQTKLKADASVVFPDKESLKRRERRGLAWWQFTAYAAAAVLLLFFGIYFFNRTDVTPGHSIDHSIAGKTPKTNPANTIVVVPNKVVDSAKNSVQDNTQQLADVNAAHDRIHHNSNSTNVTNTTNTSNHNVAFEPLPVKNINRVDEHIYTNVDFSDANYATLGMQSAVASNNETPSFGQFAMRWMKKKLDMRGNNETNDDQDGDNGDVLAMNGQNSNADVTGFDLTASAIDRLGYATNSNFHLDRNADGTVLTAFGYDVVLSRNN